MCVVVDRKMSVCQNPHEASGANDAMFALTMCFCTLPKVKLYLNLKDVPTSY